ncbi:hypothetical protein THRCLA_08898 [Thraustotheca clavata]|uniref:Ataxin-10 domain-containing protein n=1 Tax=Thraustotheca clavata TaxID=74557 RepID=A0A1V9Z1L9_9STRA|nr:hypothetical protein THRCLA_08898 [Thraustotheca clavata]
MDDINQSFHSSTNSVKTPSWAYGALLIAVLAMSSGGIWFALLTETPPLMQACWRALLMAFLQLFGVAFELKYDSTLTPDFYSRYISTLPLLLTIGLSLAVYFGAWGWSVAHTTLLNSLLLVCTIPLLLVGAMTIRFAFRTYIKPAQDVDTEAGEVERFSTDNLTLVQIVCCPLNPLPPTLLEVIGALLGFAGVVVLLLAGSATTDMGHESTLAGNAAALIGAVAGLVYFEGGSNCREWMPLFVYSFSVTFCAAILLATASLSLEATTFNGIGPTALFGFLGSWDRCGLAFGSAAISGIAGHTFANLAVKHVSPLVISVAILWEPVLGSVIGWLVHVQGIPSMSAFGATPLLILGALLVSLGSRQSGFNPIEWCKNKIQIEKRERRTMFHLSTSLYVLLVGTCGLVVTFLILFFSQGWHTIFLSDALLVLIFSPCLLLLCTFSFGSFVLAKHPGFMSMPLLATCGFWCMFLLYGISSWIDANQTISHAKTIELIQNHQVYLNNSFTHPNPEREARFDRVYCDTQGYKVCYNFPLKNAIPLLSNTPYFANATLTQILANYPLSITNESTLNDLCQINTTIFPLLSKLCTRCSNMKTTAENTQDVGNWIDTHCALEPTDSRVALCTVLRVQGVWNFKLYETLPHPFQGKCYGAQMMTLRRDYAEGLVYTALGSLLTTLGLLYLNRRSVLDLAKSPILQDSDRHLSWSYALLTDKEIRSHFFTPTIFHTMDELTALLPRDINAVHDASLLLECLETSARQCQSAKFREAFETSQLPVVFPLFLASVAKDLASHAPPTVTENHEDDDGFGYSYTTTKNALNEEETRGMTTFSDIASAERAIYIFLSSYRFLRNVCVQNTVNQSLVQPILHQTILLIETHIQWMNTGNEVLKELLALSAQIMMQFIGNAVVQHEENQRIVWPFIQPHLFEKILVECQIHRKLIGYSTAVLLNCVHSAQDGADRAQELAKQRRPLLILLLQRCLTHRTEDSDEIDPAFEWIVLLFQQLLMRKLGSDMYHNLSASLMSNLWSNLTPEQILLLRMIDLCLSSEEKKTNSSQVHASDDPTLLPFFLKEFVALHTTIKSTGDSEDVPSADREAMWQVMEIEASKLMLHILGTITTTLPRQYILEKSTQEAVTAFLPVLAKQMHEASPSRQGDLTNKPQFGKAERGNHYYGYKSAGIRVIGNLVHRNTAVQDLMRECGGIEVLLNRYMKFFLYFLVYRVISCNIDETNPMIREWALVALRHVCEGCEANQEYIKALAPQGVHSTIDLSQMGAKAVVENNKVKLESMK